MEPFVGEIRIFAGDFAPNGWALCNGQTMSIQQNTALFSLLGTNYGGNGQTTFALPNLQGSAPIGAGQGPGLTGRSLGETGGVPGVSVLNSEMAAHVHTLNSGAPGRFGGAENSPAGNLIGGATATVSLFAAPPATGAPMAATALGNAGNAAGSSGLPHNNMSPYVGVNFIIALTGVYPPRQ